MDIRLIAIDMDGTLLHSNHKISARTKKTLQKAIDAGIYVVLATGRGMASIDPYKEELNLEQPIVATNGADVYLTADSEGIKSFLAKEVVDKLLALTVKFDIKFWGYSSDNLFENRQLDQNERALCLKFGVQSTDSTKLLNYYEAIKELPDLEITSSSPTNLEINKAGVSKAVGVKMVCDHYDIKMEQVMCFGDSGNDLKLFEAVGYPVAMENAIPELKEIAKIMTVSNDKDGVAKAIEKYILTN